MDFTVLVICPQIIAIEMAFIPCVHLYVNGYSIPEYFVSNLYDLLLIRTTQVQHRPILSDVPAVTNNNLPWKVQWQKSTNLDSCSQRQDGFPHTLLSHTYIHACMQARTHIHQSIHPSTHTYIHSSINILPHSNPCKERYPICETRTWLIPYISSQINSFVSGGFLDQSSVSKWLQRSHQNSSHFECKCLYLAIFLSYRWFSTRLKQPQSVSNGVTAVLQ